jgi:hypothetical protein
MYYDNTKPSLKIIKPASQLLILSLTHHCAAVVFAKPLVAGFIKIWDCDRASSCAGPSSVETWFYLPLLKPDKLSWLGL